MKGGGQASISRYSDLGAPRVADFLYGRSLDRMLHRIGPLSLAATTVRIEIGAARVPGLRWALLEFPA